MKLLNRVSPHIRVVQQRSKRSYEVGIDHPVSNYLVCLQIENCVDVKHVSVRMRQLLLHLVREMHNERIGRRLLPQLAADQRLGNDLVNQRHHVYSSLNEAVQALLHVLIAVPNGTVEHREDINLMLRYRQPPEIPFE